MKCASPQTPRGAPKMGPLAHEPSRELEFVRRLSSALSHFGTAVEPLRGQGKEQKCVNH